MITVVCPVCLKRQESRKIWRNGQPWTSWYCIEHGDIAFSPDYVWQAGWTSDLSSTVNPQIRIGEVH